MPDYIHNGEYFEGISRDRAPEGALRVENPEARAIAARYRVVAETETLDGEQYCVVTEMAPEDKAAVDAAAAADLAASNAAAAEDFRRNYEGDADVLDAPLTAAVLAEDWREAFALVRDALRRGSKNANPLRAE